MRVRRLSPTGDFTFGGSQLDFLIDSPAAVGQVVGTSLQLWLGEWYLDTSVGMPWIQGVLGKHNQDTADVTVQDYILAVQDVTDIAEYESIAEQPERIYSATAIIDTTFGRTQVQIANSSLF